jgi:hypothetical protein
MDAMRRAGGGDGGGAFATLPHVDSVLNSDVDARIMRAHHRAVDRAIRERGRTTGAQTPRSRKQSSSHSQPSSGRLVSPTSRGAPGSASARPRLTPGRGDVDWRRSLRQPAGLSPA